MLEFLMLAPSTAYCTSREIARFSNRDIRIVGSMTGAPATPAPEGWRPVGIGADVSGVHVVRDLAQVASQTLKLYQALAGALPSNRYDEDLIDHEIARLVAPEAIDVASLEVVDGW